MSQAAPAAFAYWAGAWLAAALYTGFCAIAVQHWIGVADPQFLAQGLSAAGLFLYIGAETRIVRIGLIPIVLVVSLFTKQQEIAVPAAIFIDMIIHHRRDLIPWIVAMGVLTACGAAIGFLAGDTFLDRVFGGRGYSIYASIGTTRRLLQLVQIPASIGVLWLVSKSMIRGRTLLAALLGSTTVSMIAFAGGNGVAWNVAVDFFMCIAILAGMAADGLVNDFGLRRTGSVVLLLSLGFEIELAAFLGLGQERRQWTELKQREADFRADIAFVASRPGDAVCESMLLCYYANKPLLIDPYNSSEMVRLGKLSATDLAAPLNRREIGVVQLTTVLDDTGRDGALARPEGRFDPAVFAAVRQNYELDHVSRSGAFYVPKN